MTDMTLLPTSGFGGEAGAAGIGGLIGGGLGALLGRGVGGWGNGSWGGAPATVISGSPGGGENLAAISLAGSAANMLTTALVSDIETIQQSLGALGLSVVQGQGNTNLAIAQTGANTNNAIWASSNQNLSSLTNQNTQSMLSSVQGFAGVNTAIQQTGCATVAAIGAADRAAAERNFAAQLAAERCCCETNLNIERQSNQTRDLMRQQFADSQAVLICDMKAQIAQQNLLLSQAAQTAQLNCKINQVEQLVNFKLPTPPTPPTGCC